MPKFTFKLESLLDYRKRLEESCKTEMNDALERLEKERQRLDALETVYVRNSEEINEIKEKGPDVMELGLYYAYLNGLTERISKQKEVVSELASDFERKREKLLESSKDKKAVEKLRERSLDEFRQKMEKEEQKATDDIVSTRFKRSAR